MRQILTDATKGISTDRWRYSSEQIGNGLSHWSITKSVLCRGQQDGVEIIEVDAGGIRFTVVPTRGFTIWQAMAGSTRLGWDSPVGEIVHPRFINLTENCGFAWLRGFGAWMERCGLESIGPPCEENGKRYTLHGRISYLQAKFVEVCYQADPVPKIILCGIVDEMVSSGSILRLTAKISVEIGASTIVLSDTVTNLGNTPQDWQSLYHINFGPPLLGAGSEFFAATKSLIPRDARTAEGNIADYHSYAGPQGADYSEQVFLMELLADTNGKTKVMLVSPSKENAVVLSFNVNQLPYFALWKNEMPSNKGYVTGIEPGTSYPYPRPIERAAGRVPRLGPGESHRAEIAITALSTKNTVRTAKQFIAKLRRGQQNHDESLWQRVT